MANLKINDKVREMGSYGDGSVVSIGDHYFVVDWGTGRQQFYWWNGTDLPPGFSLVEQKESTAASGPDWDEWASGSMYGGDWLIKGNEEKISLECQHQWVDVGFNKTKIVCKKCDKEI